MRTILRIEVSNNRFMSYQLCMAKYPLLCRTSFQHSVSSVSNWVVWPRCEFEMILKTDVQRRKPVQREVVFWKKCQKAQEWRKFKSLKRSLPDSLLRKY